VANEGGIDVQNLQTFMNTDKSFAGMLRIGEVWEGEIERVRAKLLSSG
jgi:hypothetical protein